MSRNTFKTVTAVAISLCFSLGGLAHAAQTLESAEEPLHAQLKSTIDLGQAKYGDPFEATLTEDYIFEGKQLPSGTVFQGQVINAEESTSFGMPGFAKLDIQKVIFSDGKTVTFNEKEIETQDIHHQDAITIKRMIKSALPFSAVSMADALPLKLATNMSGLQILPISLVARMTLGAALEMTQKEKNWHAKKGHVGPTRLGHGLLRGTGATGMYYFLKPSPEPNMTAGTIIPIHFEEDELNQIFNAPKQAVGQASSLP